jgi:glycosyltransferase involved in cell wall biosynthesis
LNHGSNQNRLSVLLTSEGTYPFHHGGVSVWCDQLVRHIPEVDYHVFAVAPSPRVKPVFELPDNVLSIDKLPLWGTEEPGMAEIPFSQAYERKLRTTPKEIKERFAPAFEAVVRNSLAGLKSDAVKFAAALLSMQVYFEEYDYAVTLTAPATWRCFLNCLRGHKQFLLEDATTCMRWLLRYLAITARPYRRTNVIHASMAGLAAVPGTLSKLRYGTPFLLTEHGIYLRELYVGIEAMEASENCRRFLLGWNQAIVKMNYYYADVVTCLGEFNRKWQTYFGANSAKIRFIPNGVDPRRFFPERDHLPARPTVLTLARIFALKGIDVLMRAASIVREQVPNVCFRILGEVADPVYFEKCREIVRDKKLESSIEFGVTEIPEKAFGAAHVFCLPSISEGLPFTILESMFSGCPIVASDVGNISETLDGTGLLVEPNNPADLARALLVLLHGRQAAEMRDSLAAAAMDRAHRLYTIERCTQPFLNLYESLSECEQTSQIA